MPKKTETVEIQETDNWVLVRANERLAGGPNGAVEKGEEYWQPPQAAAFMAEQGWGSIVDPPVSETVDK